MKRMSILVAVALALAALPWLRASPAQAGASRSAFTALDAECTVIPGTEWAGGNVLHIRDEIDGKRIVSSDARVTGSESAVVNVDVNLATGSGAGWGTVLIQPDAVSGTWTGSFSGPITAGGFAGKGVLQGTGALQCLYLTATFQEIPVPADQPCTPGPAYDADSIAGTIMQLP